VGTGCQHYASSRLEAAGRAKLSKGAAALWGAIGAAVISRCSGMPGAGTSRSHDISDLCVTAVTFLVIQSFMVTSLCGFLVLRNSAESIATSLTSRHDLVLPSSRISKTRTLRASGRSAFCSPAQTR
jgi:hypothetical protein